MLNILLGGFFIVGLIFVGIMVLIVAISFSEKTTKIYKEFESYPEKAKEEAKENIKRKVKKYIIIKIMIYMFAIISILKYAKEAIQINSYPWEIAKVNIMKTINEIVIFIIIGIFLFGSNALLVEEQKDKCNELLRKYYFRKALTIICALMIAKCSMKLIEVMSY